MKTFIKILVGLLVAGGLFMFAFYRTPQEREFTKNLKLAKAGDMDAAIVVAQSYMHGTGTKPNRPQAVSWYEQAAAAGKAEAAWELYQYYEQQGALEEPQEIEEEEEEDREPERNRFEEDPFMGPRGPRAGGTDDFRPSKPRKNRNPEKELALAYLQSAAQANFAPAQYELGNLYAQGKALPKHQGQALFWYTKAAKNGSTAAQAKVKAFATEDPALSAQMEQFMQNLQAAEKEDPAAMVQVAQAYRQGSPVLEDKTGALEWYQKAWKKSNEQFSPAALEISDMYYQGEGMEPDAQKAAEFLAKAAELKNPQAQYMLGEAAYTDSPARMEDAFAWFSNAAAQGHAKAQYMTGFMLLQGQGTAKSVPLAIRFFEQAAEQNEPSAQYVLGQIYLKGLGVRRSPRQGRAWLERAVENGSEPAKEMLGL